ncbi:pyruvate, phosphate dikinase [Candidatus Woesearchaeota archaeon]|nr:pyruvate, phosphate dikinase [Candidatus Woesearchaeota archaeon]
MTGSSGANKPEKKLIYAFGEGHKELSDLLGGKGAGLHEMTKLGLPVPPGFTITTEAYKTHNWGGKISDELWSEVKNAVSRLETLTSKSFGGENPLLLSVRSGSKFSMPGMMDTILNLGLNDKTVKFLAQQAKDNRFAYDCYKRFLQKFGEIVLTIPEQTFSKQYDLIEEAVDTNRNILLDFLLKDEKALSRIKNKLYYRSFSDKEPDYQTVRDYLKDYYDPEKHMGYTLRHFLAGYFTEYVLGSSSSTKKGTELQIALFKNHVKQKGKEVPQDVNKQLELSIAAVFSSWDNPRAVEYRRLNNIPHDLGTAVNVQVMVFGNLGEDSATGVAFSRSPVDGKKELYGEYMINAQGEDIVSGTKTPEPVIGMKKTDTKSYNKLVSVIETLEKHYKDMQEVEFTIEKNNLWVLQTRKGKRSTLADLKILTDMVKEKLITEEDAVDKVSFASVTTSSQEALDPSKKYRIVSTGQGACLGIVSGEIVLTPEKAEKYAKQGRKCILVRKTTSTDDLKGIASAVGLLTQTGGATSHAALVARAMNKCCITGCDELYITHDKLTIGDKDYREGDMISLNGYTGDIIEGEVKVVKSGKSKNLEDLIRWSEKLLNKKLETNADTPNEISERLKSGAESIGLCRTEHLFFLNEKLTLTREYLSSKPKNKEETINKIGRVHKEYYKRVFESLQGKSIRTSLLSYPLDNFLPSQSKKHSNTDSALKKYNALLENIYQTQVKALCEAYSESEKKPKIEILIPSLVPKAKRGKLYKDLKTIIPEGQNITLNKEPEKIYFIDDLNSVSYEKLKAAETIVSPPNCSDFVKVILAKYAVKEKRGEA